MNLLRLRNLWIGIALIVAFWLGNSLVSLYSTQQLAANQAALVDSYEGRGSLYAVLSTLQDAETGERGYVITGNPLYLTPYNSALERLGGALERIKLHAIDPTANAQLNRLDELVRRKRDVMQKVIEARRRSFLEAQTLVASGDGKLIMDDIRTIVGEMITHQKEQLSERQLASQAGLIGARTTLGISTVLGIALVLCIGSVLHCDQKMRRQTDETLRVSEEQSRKLALVASRTNNAVIITDALGQIEWVNDSFTRTAGYVLADVQGNSLLDVVQSPDSDCDTLETIRENIRRGSACLLEVISARKSGEPYWNLVEIQPVRDSYDRIVNFIAIGLDISARKAAEQDIQRYANDLKTANETLAQYCRLADSANRAKSEFLANISHEIRTPMNAILGYAELLVSDGLSPSQRVNSAQGIQRNGAHLLQIINNVLDLTRIEAGKTDIQRVPCSPCQLLWDVASMMGARAIQSKLQFEVEFDGPIPERIDTDPTRFRQILLNLVGNALKFTTAGSVRVTCGLGQHAGKELLRVAVADTGIGIDPGQLERLFQPFEQADGSNRRQFGGSGLGLAISRRLAEALGGQIDVETEPGRGSTFTVWIDPGDLTGVPMIQDPSRPVQALSQKPAESSVSLAGKRILLAEDGLDNQYLISLHLRAAGAEVELAGTGKAAIECAQAAVQSNHAFDLILMDMQMPELDGYAAVRRLRDAHYQGPIVALTAHAMAGDREECLAAGCNDYLSKPVKRARLLRVVAEYCQHSQLALSTGEDPSSKDYCSEDPQLREATRQFLDRLAVRCREIRQAMQTDDRSTISSHIHQIKGAAGGYGFAEVSCDAAEIEAQLRQNANLANVRPQLESLLERCGRITATQTPQVGTAL